MNNFPFEIVLDQEETPLPVEYVDISVEKSHPLYQHLENNKVGPLRKRLNIVESEIMPISYSYDEENPKISTKRDFILRHNLTGLQIKCVKCENVKNEDGLLVLELINFYKKSILLLKNSSGEIYKFAIFPRYVKTVDVHFYRGLIFIPYWDSDEELEGFSYIFDIKSDSFIKICDYPGYSWGSMVVDETTNPSTLVFYNHDHHFSRIAGNIHCGTQLCFRQNN